MRSRGARIAAIAGSLLLGGLALGVGVAWWQRCALAEWLAVRALAARGVHAELRVARLDLAGAEIADLRLGAAAPPDLTLSHAALAWSYAGLRAGRLERIELRGLRVRARVDDDGLQLGALEALLERGEDTDNEPLALPFLEATLADAEARIDSREGTLRMRASGSAAPEGELVRATLTLRGESPQGALEFGGGGTVGLESQEIAAAGALSGVTPWGRVDGNVRALGSLAALRVELSGSALPDARALPVRAAAPIRVRAAATRDAAGVIDVELELAADRIEWIGMGAAASISAEASVREAAGVLSAESRFSLAGAELTDAGSAASVEGTATLRGGSVGATFELREIELPELARAAAASARATLDLASGAVSAHIEAPHALAPDLARLGGIAADLRIADDALSGDVHVEQLVELSQPALIAPLRLDAKLSGPLARIALSGRATTPGDGLAFDFSGTLEPEPGRLELKIVLPETDLTPKTRQPDRVFPWLAGSIERAAGRVGGEALASYANGALAASAVIALNGVDLATDQGVLRGLMGVFAVTALDPLETPPAQTIWMKSAEVGMPLGNGSVRFQLKPDGVLHVERGEWAFAGGKIVFSGAIPLDARELTLELGVEGVSVEQLLAALDFDGLSGTGVLGGVTPLVMRGAQLLVTNGELRATEQGVIRFTSGEGGAALSRKQPALSPVLGALTDLHYDELTLTLNGDISDRVEVKMHIRGRNPNFQRGRPVVLNVNVDLPLGSLLRAASVATGVPDEIEEQVQRAMGKEKP